MPQFCSVAHLTEPTSVNNPVKASKATLVGELTSCLVGLTIPVPFWLLPQEQKRRQPKAAVVTKVEVIIAIRGKQINTVLLSPQTFTL